MSGNIKQIFDANPSTALTSTDLIYLGNSPYGPTNDSAITAANFLLTSLPAKFTIGTFSNTTNQIVLGTTNTTTVSATAPASSSVYNIPDVGTSADFVMNAGIQTIAGSKTFTSAIRCNIASNQLVLGSTNTITISAPAPLASRTCSIPDAGANSSFVLTRGTQTIVDPITFSSAVKITPVTNQLVLGTTNTTTISATAPASSAIYTIPDAGTSSSFLMADGNQTANGKLTLATQLDILPATNQIRLGAYGGGGVAITINTQAQISGPFTVNFPILSTNDTFALLSANQTFNGSKTFSSALTINPVSNQLVLGTTNTATISATAPSASRTYTIPDPGANANFIMSASNQTLTGVMSYTGQPICSAYKSSTTATQTGNNTAVTVIHDTADINVNTCYNTGTGVFTAPVTGTYLFLVNLWLTNCSAVGATSNSAFVINGTSYNMVKRNIGAGFDVAGNYSYSASIVQSMSATQTAHIVAQINGFGSDTVGIGGDSTRTQRLAVIKIA